MEKKRRVISTGGKRNNLKTILIVLAIILGLALIFYISFTVSLGLFSSDNNDKATTQGTQANISGMTREELEDSYLELQEKLEQKEDEIEMLEKRLERYESAAGSAAPSTSTPDTQTSAPSTSTPDTPSSTPATAPPTVAPPTQTPTPTSAPPTQEPSTPPPASPFENEGLLSPEDLAGIEQQAGAE